MLALTFVFGESLKSVFENSIYLFVAHAFDVGDHLQVAGEASSWRVKKIGLMNSTFLKANGDVLVVPNAKLRTRCAACCACGGGGGGAVCVCCLSCGWSLRMWGLRCPPDETTTAQRAPYLTPSHTTHHRHQQTAPSPTSRAPRTASTRSRSPSTCRATPRASRPGSRRRSRCAHVPAAAAAAAAALFFAACMVLRRCGDALPPCLRFLSVAAR